MWWIPIAVAGTACLGVLTVVASTAAGRYEGQHVLTDPQEEWDAYVAEVGSMDVTAEQALHHELPWLPAPPVDPEPWRAQMTAELSPEALDDDEPLSPPPPSHPVWRNPRLDDPGPGDGESSLASPGPDRFTIWADLADLKVGPGSLQPSCLADTGDLAAAREAHPAPPSRWLAEQLEIQRAWWAWQMEKARIFA